MRPPKGGLINICDMKRFQTYLKEANAIDTAQGIIDPITLGGSFIAGLNLVAAATQAASAGMDAYQGQRSQAISRAAQAGLSAIPFARGFKAASGLSKLARVGKAIGAAGSYLAPKVMDAIAAEKASQAMARGIASSGGGNVGFVSGLYDKDFEVVDVPVSLVHDIRYKN